jgi:hypothetical protein
VSGVSGTGRVAEGCLWPDSCANELATTYEERLWGYIELDKGGRENKLRTRTRLHNHGLNPIPVYHR